jgi:hypothetical protein
VDEERRVWLERVIDAAARAAEDLRAHRDPSHHALLQDLDDLCERLRAELDRAP